MKAARARRPKRCRKGAIVIMSTPRSWGRRLTYPLLVTLAIVTVASGCLPAVRPQTTTLTLQTDLAATGLSLSEGATLQAELQKDELQIVRQLSVSNGAASATIEDLYLGTWNVRLKLIDSAGDVTHVAETEIRLVRQEPQVLELTLRPCPGMLNVHIDISSFPQRDEIQKAKVCISPGDITVTTELNDDGLTMDASLELQPADYDMKVDLYSTSTHSYNLVAEGTYQPISIHPGKTLSINWQPQTTDLQLNAEIDNPPDPPGSVSAAWDGTSCQISWEASPDSEGDLYAYRIYYQSDPLLAYDLLKEVSRQTTSITYTPTSAELGTELRFVVTAVDAGGLESQRSLPASVFTGN